MSKTIRFTISTKKNGLLINELEATGSIWEDFQKQVTKGWNLKQNKKPGRRVTSPGVNLNTVKNTKLCD